MQTTAASATTALQAIIGHAEFYDAGTTHGHPTMCLNDSLLARFGYGAGFMLGSTFANNDGLKWHVYGLPVKGA
jgi:hypothetical protein